MNRLHVATRGIGSWRERLKDPDTQWKRGFSAFETAVSWEIAAHCRSGLPGPIVDLFRNSDFGDPELAFAVAEHRVALPGGLTHSQCDVWAVLNTRRGGLSLSVEAKAQEPFGSKNEPLAKWLLAGESDVSVANRQQRWAYIQKHLPDAEEGRYWEVPYQLLHRCATAVIEAKRLCLADAALVVQAFQSPAESFEQFAGLCAAMNIASGRGQMWSTSASGVRLTVGWADCPLATDEQVAAVA